MNEAELPPPQPLPPHQYPRWVILFCAAVCLAVLAGLLMLPRYYTAARRLRAADQAYAAGRYIQAEELYEDVLVAVPTSRSARLGTAKAIFADGDPINDPTGLALLRGVHLSPSDWDELARHMPPQYQAYFTETTRVR